MDRKTKWRTFWLLLLVGMSALALLATVVGTDKTPSWFPEVLNRKIDLGLDLAGGRHLVYSIDLDKVVDDKATVVQRELQTVFDEDKIAVEITTPLRPLGAVNVVAKDASKLDQVRATVNKEYGYLAEFLTCEGDVSANAAVCFRVSSDYGDGIKEDALSQAILTIRERITQDGASDPSVIRKGDQLIVELPGVDESEHDRMKQRIESTAKLEFKVVDNGSDYMRKLYAHVVQDPQAKELGITAETDSWRDKGKNRFDDYLLRADDRERRLTKDEARELNLSGCAPDGRNPDKLTCQMPGQMVIEQYLENLAKKDPAFAVDDKHEIGYEKVFVEADLAREQEDPCWRTYYLVRACELTGTSVKDSSVTFNQQTNSPEVLVKFDRWGGRRFGEMTGANVGKKMAIILDGVIKSAPIIQVRIDQGASSITMGGDTNALEEANRLVGALKSGSLVAELELQTETKIGPSLGIDAIDKAKLAFLLGSALVVVIMIYYYRVAGVIAVAALALNILFMLAILAVFRAKLTLPGIAALVLTVGMAVDANIIVYERIREELRVGKSIKGAVDAGFSHGFLAILDGQITTALAGYVLFELGSGPIKGFAVMLIIGIVCTLFTALWCTRLFFEYYVGRGSNRTTIAI